MKNLMLALAAIAMLATPAQAQTRAELLGNWRCDLDSPAITMSITTTYLDDGEFVSVGTSQAQTANGPLNLHASAYGRWSLENGQIIETVGTMSLFSASLNGVPITPDTPVYAQLLRQVNSTAGQPNIRTLVALTPETYTITYEGYRQTCNRRR